MYIFILTSCHFNWLADTDNNGGSSDLCLKRSFKVCQQDSDTQGPPNIWNFQRLTTLQFYGLKIVMRVQLRLF